MHVLQAPPGWLLAGSRLRFRYVLYQLGEHIISCVIYKCNYSKIQFHPFLSAAALWVYRGLIIGLIVHGA